MNKKRPTVLEWAVQEGIPCPALTIQQQAEEIARLQGESAALRQALEAIRRDYGKVCENFELCDCVSCASSYGAWATADAVLSASDAGAKEAAGCLVNEWREAVDALLGNEP